MSGHIHIIKNSVFLRANSCFIDKFQICCHLWLLFTVHFVCNLTNFDHYFTWVSSQRHEFYMPLGGKVGIWKLPEKQKHHLF